MHTHTSHTSHVGTVILLALVGIILVCALWIYMGICSQETKEQGVISIKQSVIASAMQCFAIEGAYPSNLKYLEDNYGLTINHDDYVVTYDAFAGNVLPSVAVRVK